MMSPKEIISDAVNWWETRDPQFNVQKEISDLESALRNERTSLVKCLSLNGIVCKLQWVVVFRQKQYMQMLEKKITNQKFQTHLKDINGILDSEKYPEEIKLKVVEGFEEAMCKQTVGFGKKERLSFFMWSTGKMLFIREEKSYKYYFGKILNIKYWGADIIDTAILTNKTAARKEIGLILNKYFKKIKVKKYHKLVATFLYIFMHEFHPVKPTPHSYDAIRKQIRRS